MSKTIENEDHAELSASGSERWLNCPGSVALSKEAPEPEESPYAIEGTKAHDLLEKWATHLRDKLGAFTFPKTGVHPAMVQAVRVAVEDLQKSWRKGRDLLIEEKVSLEPIDPLFKGMFGTADLLIVEHFGHLEVADYKHGSGVRVEVVKEGLAGKTLNTQLVYYALGAAARFDFNFESVTLKVIQPRANHENGPIRKVTVSMKEIMAYIDLFKKGVERTKQKNARRFAGPWCRFCRAKPICKEGSQAYKTDCRDDFDVI